MSEERHCGFCGKRLAQRPAEIDPQWEQRRHCGNSCAARARARQRQTVTDEQLVEIWKFAGTLQLTGEVVGLTRERVRQRLKRQGIVSKAVKMPRGQRIKQIAAILEAGVEAG